MYTTSIPKSHYEITGSGNKALIMVHGNKEDMSIFNELCDSLKEHYTIYLVDSRGHGRSANVKEYHYSDMADDILRIIDECELKSPSFFGFSDGAIVGMLCAIKRKNAFSNMMLAGGNADVKGLKWYSLLAMSLGSLITKDKRTKMMLREPHITKEELGSIVCRTMILAGENDLIRKKHTEYIAKTINNSNLKIYPKKHHGDYVVHSDFLKEDIIEFLG